jgi:hypothetical protein
MPREEAVEKLNKTKASRGGAVTRRKHHEILVNSSAYSAYSAVKAFP